MELAISVSTVCVAASFEVDVSQVLILQEGSLLKCSLMNAPTSVKVSLSDPSTAMTAPRISWAGLVGHGASGGEILVKTLILFTYGIVITIASILFA